MPEEEMAEITRIITSALPGSTTEPMTVPGFRERLAAYRGVDASRFRQHLVEFLEAVTPAAEALGVKLTLHPDDPPRPLFGLPRIASTANDYAALFDAVPSQANGMCFCTGSLGVREDNDLPAIARRFAGRIHFAHLRATAREKDGRSFHESAHLEGDVDMVAVLKELVTEDRRRSGEKHHRLPLRPRPPHARRPRKKPSPPATPPSAASAAWPNCAGSCMRLVRSLAELEGESGSDRGGKYEQRETYRKLYLPGLSGQDCNFFPLTTPVFGELDVS